VSASSAAAAHAAAFFMTPPFNAARFGAVCPDGMYFSFISLPHPRRNPWRDLFLSIDNRLSPNDN
jgi:hypothetical protein